MSSSGPAGIQVEGMNTLRRTLRRAAADLDDLTDAHTRAATITARAASSLAPRRTGALASSLRPSGAATEARVVSSLRYATPVHAGVPSRNIPARPFLTTAAADTQSRWLTVYEAALEQAIQKVRGI